MAMFTMSQLYARPHVLEELIDGNEVTFNKLVPIDYLLFTREKDEFSISINITLKYWGTKWSPDGASYNKDENMLYYSTANGDGNTVLETLCCKYPDEIIYCFCEYEEGEYWLYRNSDGNLLYHEYGHYEYDEDPEEKHPLFARDIEILSKLVMRIDSAKNDSEKETIYNEALKYDGLLLKFITKQTENNIRKALKNTPQALVYVNNLTIDIINYVLEEEDQLKKKIQEQNITEIDDLALLITPFYIKRITSPTEEQKINAINRDVATIKYITNQTNELKNNIKEFYYQTAILKYIENPSEEIIRKAINFDSRNIEYVENPTQEIIELAVSKNLSLIKKYDISDNTKIEIVKAQPHAARYFQEISDAFLCKLIDINENVFKYIKNPNQEIIDYAIYKNPDLSIYLSTELGKDEIKLEKINSYIDEIDLIPYFSETLQEELIKKDVRLLNYIKNPSLSIKKMALKFLIKSDESGFKRNMNKYHIENPNKELVEIAIKDDIYNITIFRNMSSEVMEYAISIDHDCLYKMTEYCELSDDALIFLILKYPQAFESYYKYCSNKAKREKLIRKNWKVALVFHKYISESEVAYIKSLGNEIFTEFNILLDEIKSKKEYEKQLEPTLQFQFLGESNIAKEDNDILLEENIDVGNTEYFRERSKRKEVSVGDILYLWKNPNDEEYHKYIYVFSLSKRSALGLIYSEKVVNEYKKGKLIYAIANQVDITNNKLVISVYAKPIKRDLDFSFYEFNYKKQLALFELSNDIIAFNKNIVECETLENITLMVSELKKIVIKYNRLAEYIIFRDKLLDVFNSITSSLELLINIFKQRVDLDFSLHGKEKEIKEIANVVKKDTDDRKKILNDLLEDKISLKDLDSNLLSSKDFILEELAFRIAKRKELFENPEGKEFSMYLAIVNDEAQHISNNLLNDKDVAKLLIELSGTSISYLSDELKADEEIVLLALNQNPAAYQYLNETLKEKYKKYDIYDGDYGTH